MPIHFLCGMREKIYLFPLLLHLKFFIPAKIYHVNDTPCKYMFSIEANAVKHLQLFFLKTHIFKRHMCILFMALQKRST